MCLPSQDQPFLVCLQNLYVDVSAAFGLSVNMVTTLFMAVGHGITDCDRAPLSIHDAQVQHASRFSYLGSIVTPDGCSHADV